MKWFPGCSNIFRTAHDFQEFGHRNELIFCGGWLGEFPSKQVEMGAFRST